MNISFESLYADLLKHDLVEWRALLPEQLSQAFDQRQHGKREEWEEILSALPDFSASSYAVDADRVSVGQATDISPEEQEKLKSLLMQLHPWRKGPYELFGVHIDCEWRSDWKWQRIRPHLSSLNNRRVLDIGCGNGYHMWRMLAEGAQLVVGADPSQFFLVQFHTIKHYLSLVAGELPVHLLPFKSEELPALSSQEFKGKGFDTVFSMGVLYHRVSPITHLQELKSFLRAGGELVLETLVIEGADQEVLLPQDRYAQMRNVWFLPTTALLMRMLERVGFKDIKLVDVNQTSLEEQRKTDWMTFDSLGNFLDPVDRNKTVEGHPSPKRAVIIATK